MRTRILAPVLVMVGLLLTACGSSTSTETITQSAAASTTTEATATSTTQAGSGTGSSTSSTSSTSTIPASDLLPNGLTEEQMLELMNLITVKTITATPCVDLVGEAVPGSGLIRFDIGALKKDVTQGGPRLWTDALSTPVPKELLEPEINIPGLVEFFDEQSCLNPHFGVADLHRFARMEIYGVKLVDELPWLKPFAVDVEELDELASEYVFNDLTEAEKADPEVQRKVTEANKRWQVLTAKLNTLRSRFATFGVLAIPSNATYHLVGVTGVGSLPEIGIDPELDVLPALVYGVTLKNSCPQVLFGYNVGDQRPEVFNPEPCEPPTPPTSTNPPPTVTTPPPTVTTPPPGVTTTTVPPCVPPEYRDESGKCVPPNTVPPSPETTVAPTTPTTQAGSATTVAAGPGATNTSVPPTTSAPAPAPPTTATPVSNPPEPGDG